MSKSLISEITTDNAPKAIGPYSQAVRAGDFIFVSGQIPLDPVSATTVSGGIKEQTNQALMNIKAILLNAGVSLDKVVKTEVYLKDINDFSSMNEVYATFFTSNVKPARQAMQVARLPRDVLVEISCIAYAKD